MISRISVTVRSVFPNARIELVILTEDDAATLVHPMNDYDVTRTLTIDRPMTLDDEKKWLAKVNDNPASLVFGIWLPEAQKLIGTAGLHGIDQRSRTAVFGIQIGDKTEWRKGYATETLMQILHLAFLRKNLRIVTLDVLANNPRAQACYERCGFVEMGRLKAYEYRDGIYHDRIIMQLFKEAWMPLFERMEK